MTNPTDTITIDSLNSLIGSIRRWALIYKETATGIKPDGIDTLTQEAIAERVAGFQPDLVEGSTFVTMTEFEGATIDDVLKFFLKPEVQQLTTAAVQEYRFCYAFFEDYTAYAVALQEALEKRADELSIDPSVEMPADHPMVHIQALVSYLQAIFLPMAYLGSALTGLVDEDFPERASAVDLMAASEMVWTLKLLNAASGLADTAATLSKYSQDLIYSKTMAAMQEHMAEGGSLETMLGGLSDQLGNLELRMGADENSEETGSEEAPADTEETPSSDTAAETDDGRKEAEVEVATASSDD